MTYRHTFLTLRIRPTVLLFARRVVSPPSIAGEMTGSPTMQVGLSTSGTGCRTATRTVTRGGRACVSSAGRTAPTMDRPGDVDGLAGRSTGRRPVRLRGGRLRRERRAIPSQPTRSAGSTRKTLRSCTGSALTSASAPRSSAISARTSAPTRRCGARGPIRGTLTP